MDLQSGYKQIDIDRKSYVNYNVAGVLVYV